MAVISGNAKKNDGTAIDYVSIFNWADGKCIAQVVPDAAGNWSHEYAKTIKVGITYVADACKPITHGAYEFIGTRYRYWRISHVVARASSKFKGISELQFISPADINLATNSSKGFASHYYGSPNVENAPANAFDGDPSTWTEVKFENTTQDWSIGYDFGEPVSITKVGVRGRNDLPPSQGREWKTADVEVSDDNVTWIKYGTIAPMTTAEDSSLVITPVIPT